MNKDTVLRVMGVTLIWWIPWGLALGVSLAGLTTARDLVVGAIEAGLAFSCLMLGAFLLDR